MATLYDLAEGAGAEHVEDNVLVAGIRAESAVDVQDVVAILVVVAIIFARFARLGQNATWVLLDIMMEFWIARGIDLPQTDRQRLDRLVHNRTHVDFSALLFFFFAYFCVTYVELI